MDQQNQSLPLFNGLQMNQDPGQQQQDGTSLNEAGALQNIDPNNQPVNN